MVYTFVVFGLECNFPAHSHQALRQESYSKLHISWGACGARPSSTNNENDIVKTGPVNVDKDLNRQQGMCQAFTVDGEAANGFNLNWQSFAEMTELRSLLWSFWLLDRLNNTKACGKNIHNVNCLFFSKTVFSKGRQIQHQLKWDKRSRWLNCGCMDR